MNEVRYTMASVEETIRFGKELGSRIEKPMTFLLIGDLGAGKTHLSQAIAEGLGVEETITSPTFALMNTYRSGRLPLYHFDLYRLESEEELENIGFYEYVKAGVALVEWADKFLDAMPRRNIQICIEKTGETTRTIVLRSKLYKKEQLAQLGGLNGISD